MRETAPAARAIRGGLIALFAALVAVTVYYGVISDAPLPDHRLIVGFNDLVLHLAAFFALALVGLLLWPATGRVLTVALLAAIALEVCQAFEPGREASLRDVAAGMVGALAAAALVGLGRAAVAAAARALAPRPGSGSPEPDTP